MRPRNILPFALLLLSVSVSLPVSAQEAAAVAAPATTGLLENPTMETNYMLLAMAVLQVVIIITLSGIMKTLGGTGTVWADYLKGRKMSAVLVLVFATASLNVSAAVPELAMITTQTLMYWLMLANVIFFIIIVSQLTVVRGMVKALSGPEEEAARKAAEGPSFADSILNKLTRTVKVEKEQDILMHHEYDGIRELDNVLPPWWLWLFYGTIIWSVVYIFNVHISGTWLHQADEYEQEMAQAKADVEAYLANAAASVDENTVTLMAEANDLAAGKNTFVTYCKACHGENGEGNAVGPNLTDAYWLHGGDIKNVFTTIKYGVVEKGMQSWKKDLKPAEMQQVASYILSLQGSNPANAKAPQGDLWKPADATVPADSSVTAAPVDSAAVAIAQ